jgi:hypothetical protein
MIKTQVQFPDCLYREAKRVAREREISFAEVVRRGVEYITRAYPASRKTAREWTLPAARNLGPFKAPPEAWRTLANEERGVE